MDQICLSNTSHCLIVIWGIWRPHQHFDFFIIFLRPILSKFLTVWQGTYFSCWKTLRENYFLMKGCSWFFSVSVGGACKNDIHVNAWTKVYLEHYTHPIWPAVLEMFWPVLTIWPLLDSLRSIHLPIFHASNTSTLRSVCSLATLYCVSHL